MYIQRIIDKNIGPLADVDICMPFDKNRNPKPIILVGENGSGKSTFLSNIVDSFYELARQYFRDAINTDELGNRDGYYKVISPLEIRFNQQFLFSIVYFEEGITYLYKTGKIDFSRFKELSNIKDDANIIENKWSSDDNIKAVIGENKEQIMMMFNNGIICYFSPDRYEEPFWLGTSYYDQKRLHPEIHSRYSGQIMNPIMPSSSGQENLQWLLDVIADSRIDIYIDEIDGILKGKAREVSSITYVMRNNIEKVMSEILGEPDGVYFDLNIRQTYQGRFCIKRKKDETLIAPTMNSLSTGQLALFNMFATIIRYADNNDVRKSISLENISGIVIIDEIELHLHTSLQKEVLPRLIHLFPKVQFIITTHSPLFLLGMEDLFGSEGYEIYQLPEAVKINVERFSEFKRAYQYFSKTNKYQIQIRDAINKSVGNALVITEGPTDWKHMKAAKNALSQKEENKALFSGLNFDFLEYESPNGESNGTVQLNMGAKTLLSMCEMFSKIPQKRKLIFVADRDQEDINKKMGNETIGFKDWGNHVYSFVLPVPESRKSTPNICIEHYYSNQEIKTKYEENNIQRRLFMGNEFDSRGNGLDNKFFCCNRNICGKEKINIIEGSTKERVILMTDHSENPTNYALPKNEFAELVLTKAHGFDKFNFDNFLLIFEVIKKILEKS